MSARLNAVSRASQSPAFKIRSTRMGSDAPVAQIGSGLQPTKPAGMWREYWAKHLMQISPNNRLPRGFGASQADAPATVPAQGMAVQNVVAISPAAPFNSPAPAAPRIKTLRECLPPEFMTEEFESAASRKWADVEVVANYDASTQPWPGKEKNVNVWYALANGRAVGFNENPARGWSFPLIKWDVGAEA